MQKADRFNPEDNFLAVTADGDLIETFNRTVRLALAIPEGCKIMFANKTLSRLMHRFMIEMTWHTPGTATIQRQRRTAVYDPIEISPSDGMKTGMKIICDRFG